MGLCPLFQLCDYHAGSAVVQCGYGGFCTGSVSACHPSHIWSGTVSNSASHSAAPVWAGGFSLQALSDTYAFSVRCYGIVFCFIIP